MAKENSAIKPRPKLTFGQWALALVGAAILLFGLHLAGIINIPFFDTFNFGSQNTKNLYGDELTIGVPYEVDFSSALIPLLPPESTGGPYTFYLGSGVGFPPMGMILGIDGVLRGTPTTAGDNKFEVCVKDVGGRSVCKTYHIIVNSGTNSPSTTTKQPAKTLWEGTLNYRAYSDFGSPEDSGICESTAKIRICMTRTGQNVEATYELYDSQELSKVITGYGQCPIEVIAAGGEKEAPSFSGQLDSNGNLNVEWFSFQEHSYRSSSNAGNPNNPDDRDQITASILDNTMNFELLYKSVWTSQTVQKNTVITATKVADTC